MATITETLNKLSDETATLLEDPPTEPPPTDTYVRDLNPGLRERFNLLPTCPICTKKVYADGKFGTFTDHKFVRPCLCNEYVHHACAASHLIARKRCPTCQKRYNYRSYGNVCDFVVRQKCTLLFTCFMYAFILFCGSLMAHSIYADIRLSKDTVAAQLVMLAMVVILLVVATLICVLWINYVYTVKWAHFRQRYQQITFNSHPDVEMSRKVVSSYPFSDAARFGIIRADEEDSSTDPESVVKIREPRVARENGILDV